MRALRVESIGWLAAALLACALPVAAFIAAPVASPVASPVVSPVASPVVSPVASPVAAPVAAPVVAPVVAQEPLEGRWTAEARLGPEAMTLLLDVERRDGELRGRISVPAERVLGLRLEAFVCGDSEVAFRIPHPDHPMGFAGRLESEQRLQGELGRARTAARLPPHGRDAAAAIPRARRGLCRRRPHGARLAVPAAWRRPAPRGRALSRHQLTSRRRPALSRRHGRARVSPR